MDQSVHRCTLDRMCYHCGRQSFFSGSLVDASGSYYADRSAKAKNDETVSTSITDGNENNDYDELLGPKLKSTLKLWCQRTSSHGIPNIVHAEYFKLKVMWTTVFFLSTFCLAFMVKRCINSYFQYEVVTQIKSIREDQVSFPTVTICNSSPFSTNYSHAFVKNYLERYDLLDVQRHVYPELQVDTKLINHDDEYINLMRQLVQRYLNTGNVTDEEKRRFGLPLEDMVISCRFNDEPCRLSEFRWYFDQEYGNCYQYNSGYELSGRNMPLKQLNRSGIKYGLQLELFINGHNNLYSLSKDNGFRLFVSNQSVDATNSQEMGIMLGFRTEVAVYRTLKEMLPYPYNNCRVEFSLTPFYTQIKAITNNGTYRQDICLNIVYQKKLVEQCKCYDAMYPRQLDLDDIADFEGKLEACSNVNQTKCQVDTYLEVFNTESIKRNADVCPFVCSTSKLTAKPSFLRYPSRSYSRQLLGQERIRKLLLKEFPDMNADSFTSVNGSAADFAVELLKERMSNVVVYFDDLSYTLIDQKAKTELIDLIASIGGIGGICLGISFLSLMEIVEIFIKMVIVIWMHYIKKRRRLMKTTSKRPIVISSVQHAYYSTK